MTQIPRSALVLGMAGAVFFIVAGGYGVIRGGIAAPSSVLYLLFLVVGAAALAGAIVLWRRAGPRA